MADSGTVDATRGCNSSQFRLLLEMLVASILHLNTRGRRCGVNREGGGGYHVAMVHGRVTRRRFLAGTAALGAGAILPGCGGEDSPASPTSSSSTTGGPGTPATTASTSTPGTTAIPPADYRSLRSRINGDVLLPIDDGYDDARLLFNPRFDGTRPAAIARCINTGDVQAAVLFARRAGIPLAARGGGHSYGGYSTGRGLVIDTRAINTVSFATSRAIASVGSGAQLIDVYGSLAAFGFTVPAGSCATVGITGLALGGGMGVLDRSLGLTCDAIEKIEIVTADAEVRTCSETENADLFWACRGGGGGNFGIVTRLDLRATRVPELRVFSLEWPFAAAETVVAAWQEWAPTRRDETWANCVMVNKATGPTVTVNGVFRGSLADMKVEVDALVALAGVPSRRDELSFELMETMLYEAGCARLSLEECRLPAAGGSGKLQREAQFAASAFFDKAMPAAGVATMVESIRKRQGDPSLRDGAVILDPMGGTINRVAPDATAFVHRRQQFSAQYYSPFAANNLATANAAEQWVKATRESLASHASGFAYQNYIDASQPNWLDAYYGSNLGRLKQVKQKYDPEAFFRHAQSIPVG